MRARLAIAAVLSVFAVSSASASPSEALEDVKDAIVVADETGGRCKRDVFDDLLAIRDLLRDGSNARAAVRIQRTRRQADRCPASVDRALRRAESELADERRQIREVNEDRRERRERQAPKRPDNVPFMDWKGECIDEWLMLEIARGRLADRDLDVVANMFAPLCTNPDGMGAARYSNGQTAKSSSNAWYYPNGQTAKSSSGAFYYPNGQTARSSSGSWYYPNGQTAWANDAWYYPNGNRAGDYLVLVNWAKQTAGEHAVRAYEWAMQSDVDAWRAYAILRLATHAR
jgi:hypothetical protein